MSILWPDLAYSFAIVIDHTRAAPFIGRLIGTLTVAVLLLSSSLNGRASDFADGFETATPGLVIASTRLPEPGSVLPALAQPTISARFVPWPNGVIPNARVFVDGIEFPGVQTSEDSVSLTLAGALPEGRHDILVLLRHQSAEAQAQWSFETRTVPDILGLAPVDGMAFDESNPVRIRADFHDTGAGIDPDQTRLFLDDLDVTAAASRSDHFVSLVRGDLSTGRHTLRLVIADRAGNITEVRRWFQFGAIPRVSQRQPAPGTPSDSSLPVRIGARIDSIAGVLAPQSLRLWVDGDERTNEVQIELQPGGQRMDVLWVSDPPLQGHHEVRLHAATEDGAQVQDEWQFTAVVPEYQMEILEPASGTRIDGASVRVKVAIDTNLDLPEAVRAGNSVCRLQAHSEVRGEYLCLVELGLGNNSILVEARFAEDVRISESIEVTQETPFRVHLETPLDLQTFGPLEDPVGNSQQLTGAVARPILITGRSNRPLVSVQINQQAAEVIEAGLGFRFDRFFLHEGTNLLTAVARDADGNVASVSVTVYSDQTAPLISVFAPEPDAVTSSQSTEIHGRVVDVVGPIVGNTAPVVRIRNLDSGYEQSASVVGQQFRAARVPLLIGRNRLMIDAVDQVGNERSRSIEVTRYQVGAVRLSALSGNDQTGLVGQVLPTALAVRLVDASGEAVVGRSIRFDVMRGSGYLANPGPFGSDGLNPPRNLSRLTDAEGIATVHWTLGDEAGVAANLLRVSVDGTPEQIHFAATGLPGPPSLIRSDGNSASQFVTAGQTVLEPLTINVTDASYNTIATAPVRFRVLSGQANFLERAGVVVAPDGQSVNLACDERGVGAIRLRAGDRPGPVVVVAELLRADGTIANRSYFQLTVLAGQAGPTRFSGEVRSHSGAPLEGVRISIDRTSLMVTTDSAGRFHFDDQVPAGRIDLFVDGRAVAAGPDGHYPSLHFEAQVSPGQDNQLMHAIHLPPIDLGQAVQVGGSEDVSITIPGIEGFRMTVMANSVTFPDGSRTGPLTVTAVTGDRLPMVPQGGSSSFGAVAWTIQPSGTRFDPPIQVSIPNLTGLRPGRSVPLYQWDHDLATFVPMGVATVGEDAAELVSEPGMGITKAGWGGGPPPVPPNDGENDPPKCPVRGAVECECTEADNVQRPQWKIAPPERVEFPAIGKLGFTIQEELPEQEALACKKCSDGEAWYITGGDALNTRVKAAINLPRIQPSPGLQPRTEAQIADTIRHENVHATHVDEIKTKHWSYLEGKFGSIAECEAAITSAKDRFQDDYNQAHYRQCLHLDHAGETLFTADAAGNQVDSGLRYPLQANMPGFAQCEAMAH